MIIMADRGVRRRKKKEEDDEKPSEEETAVGKHLRFNLPTKTSKIGGHKVEYFTGSKAVDFLLDSKWASGEKGTKVIFTDRHSVVRYLNELLFKGMFYRALKVVKKSKKEKEEEKKEKKSDKKKEKEKTKEKEKEKKEEKGKQDNEKEDPSKKSKEGKRKIRLEPTDDQFFADGNDAYVWVFDPIKPMYYVYGALLVIGAIAVCLFPLWPHWMRIGTYYTSLGGAGVVGSVLVLAICRLVIFSIVWTTTMGKIHFWLFPNLLADVGILESFQPVYTCDYMTTDKKENKESAEEDKENDDEQGKVEESENSKTETPEELKATDIEEKEKDLNIEKQTDEKLPKLPIEEKESTNEEKNERGEGEENEGSSKSGSSAENGQEGFEFIEQEEISAASEEQDPDESS